MTTFEDREQGYERKFTHDQELRFKVSARRNRLLGLWAAEKLGLRGDAAEAYAKEVVMADFDKPGDDDVLDKVLKDLTAKGVPATSATVRTEMERLSAVARDQLMKKD